MKPTMPKKQPVVTLPSGGLSKLVLPISQEDKYLSTGELQQIIPVTRRTLLRWRAQNILPAITIGRTVMYSSRMVHDIIQHKFDQIRPPLD